MYLRDRDMSIVTKTGDHGATALMYNRRVPKSHPRIEACGSVDELNAALGLARATAQPASVCERIIAVQKDLIILMGELATAPEDLPRYVSDGFSRVSAEMTAKLERWVEEIEAQKISPAGWATPGASQASAALDLARAVCRRAERRVCALQEAGQFQNAEIIVYLNRLSDLLWLLARAVEAGT
jgi:cob(I)alamin adenosyltransferase